MTTLTAPEPKTNETEDRYTIRAHRSLMAAVPDPSERNEIIWNSWDSANGPSRGKKLDEKHFGNSRFVPSPGHCYFVEHETPGPKGDIRKFGVTELCSILRENNSQVLDRENFHAISIGHTASRTADDAGHDPEVAGYAGPYRLGMVGHDTPVFAIFGDEYHRADKAAELATRPRRSVELITVKSTGQRWFDPIAALGSTAPRLPMPARYSQPDDDDADIDRYQAVAPASMPGSSNSYVRSDSSNYDSQEGGHQMALADSDIAQIVEAMSNTPEIQFIRKQMQGAGAGPDAGGGDPAAAGGLDAPGGDAPHPGGMTPLDDDGDMGGGLGGGAPPSKFSASDDVTIERYRALENEVQEARKERAFLVGEHKKLVNYLGTQKKQTSDVARRSALETVVNRYSIFDIDEECEKCLYSAGSEMSDEAFEKHVDGLKKLGGRTEAMGGNSIPRGSLPTADNEVGTERYGATHNRALEIWQASSDSGEELAYDVCVGKAKAELNGSAK